MPKNEPLTLTEINDCRARVAGGEEVTDEELQLTVDACRAGRYTAKPGSGKKQKVAGDLFATGPEEVS